MNGYERFLSKKIFRKRERERENSTNCLLL